MIPFLPGRRARRADDPHSRARELAADRLGEPLGSDDEAWLVAHLAGCVPCTAVTAEFDEQRTLLRGLPTPEPPRDLWARTRAAIELEAGPPPGRRRRSWIPLGALSGALVVAVVVGASMLSMPTVHTPVTTPSPTIRSSSPPSAQPMPTPIEVAAGDVGWLLPRGDGTYALAYAPVEQVCAGESAPDCPLLDAPSEGTLVLDAAPRAIVASPTEDQLVVVAAGTGASGGSVYVVPVPSPDASAEPSPPPPSVEPSASPPAEPSSPPPSAEPTVSPSPSASPLPSVSPGPSPSNDPAVSPSAGPSASPSADPGPLAIAAGVIVVGETAGYSPDGSWFAFAARPADGSRGPDIFVWRSGMTTARQLTADGRSVFAAWVGGRILGSRVVEVSPESSPGPSVDPSTEPSATAAPPAVPSAVATSVSFFLDPETGAEVALEGDGIWRPVVDPNGRFAVYWEGTIELDPTGVMWRPGDGRIVVAAWDASPSEPDPSASPATSASPVVSEPATLIEGSVRDWDIHWDETGTRFAVWLMDPVDNTLGALTLHVLDPETGAVDPDGPVIADVPALAGFSIGDGRLAWATPPGQDGEGSRVQVLAWSGADAGRIESQPGTGSEPILVIR